MNPQISPNLVDDSEMPEHVFRSDNVLQFNTLANPFVVGDFVRSMSEAIRDGHSDVVLDFRTSGGAFPNVCTPIAGLLEYYEQSGITFTEGNLPEYVVRSRMLNPRSVADHAGLARTSPMNTVWYFKDADDVSVLTSAFVDGVSRAAVCGEGVLQALEWSINEVMDNVLQHSAVDRGFIMGQVHPSTNHIAFCVFDYGRGIFNTLRESHHPRSAVDAITLAIREGVTRDSRIGQGNGLWGLHNIVRQNEGFLTITTGPGQYSFQGEETKTRDRVPYLDREHNCTTVDFQIDYDHGIALSVALGGHQPTNLRVEALEDDRGNIRYKLRDKSSGTGTRQSGLALRNEVANLCGESTAVVLLDFDGISVVSSSFADEFVGKLVVAYGFIGFAQRFRFINMNDAVATIVNRSVAQRVGESVRGSGDES